VDLVSLIGQLRGFVPLFDGRVAGMVEWDAVMRGELRPEQLPAAYVLPLEEDATDNDEQNALYQEVKQRVGVVVEFDNSLDRRGQSVTQLYEPMRAAINKAILNWRATDPDHALRGFEYSGGRLLAWDDARVFYQFEYTQLVLLTDADGWQVDVPYLLEIDANMAPGDPAPGFRYVAPVPPQPSPPTGTDCDQHGQHDLGEAGRGPDGDGSRHQNADAT
jgi:hypothetical protein